MGMAEPMAGWPSNPSKQKHCDKRGAEKFPINITWVFLYQLTPFSAYCAVIAQADTENRERIHLFAQSKDSSPFLAHLTWPQRKSLSWSQYLYNVKVFLLL